MREFYYSCGKLLLTGEYLVLKGAEAIALPLKLGQHLQIRTKGSPGQIVWNSYYKDEKVFEGVFSSKNNQFISTSDKDISEFLAIILTNVKDKISQKLNETGLTIDTFLEFPFQWGFGSSSSLINNIATWLQIDPFQLNNRISNGSGYDIACARSKQPIIYKNNGEYPTYKEIQLIPSFKDNLYFIYTGRKQNSTQEIRKYLNFNNDQSFLKEIQSINHEILNSNTLATFENAINEHEKLISGILNKPTIQEMSFPDFPGKIKSLGAWGGDFILATWENGKEELLEYFKRHNMNILFSWDELIKNGQNAE